MLYTNANGLANKMAELKIILSSGKYKTACITETHMNCHTSDTCLQIPQFDMHREDRSGRNGGGTIIYVHQSYNVKRLNFFDKLETVALDVSNDKGQSFVLVCFYRSCNSSVNDNQSLIDELTRLTKSTNKVILAVGDANLPDVDWNLSAVAGPLNSTNKKIQMQRDMLDCFLMNGLSWCLYNNDITRRRLVGVNLQEAVLDQVLCTKTDFVLHIDKLAPLGKSDHICLGMALNFKSSVDDSKLFASSKRLWSKCDSQFLLDLSYTINWAFSSNSISVDEMWEELYSKFQQIEKDVPLKVQKLDRKGNILKDIPWDTSFLVRKRKEKNHAWTEFDLDPCTATFYTALSKQDEYEKAELKAKSKHETKVVKNLKHNCKPFFHYLNSMQKSKVHVTKVKKTNGELSSTFLETVEILADHFHSVYKKDELGPLQEECYNHTTQHYNCPRVAPVLETSKDKVAQLLSGLDINKAMGPDNMPPKFLKALSKNPAFVKAVTMLFNKCFEEEKIPSAWKNAHVIPVHKKGSYLDPNNYRPISLTCVLGKVYERILAEHLLDQISLNLSQHQHGFRRGKSCLSNLLETVKHVMDCIADSGKFDILYFDFSKAFDSVSHHKLLIKLENLGVDAKTRSIIKDFLSDRKFQVKVGDVLSAVKLVLSGIIQGSVIGPLLFLIFINDLPGLINCFSKLFADDLKVVSNPLKLNLTTQDLQTLEEWQQIWGLNFNMDKCKVIHFLQSDKGELIDYPFLDDFIEPVEEEKDLGVVFDSKFDFHTHIEKCIASAKSKFGWLKRELVSRKTEVFLPVYKQLIRPHLEYCPQVWSPVPEHGNWCSIMNIESVQREVTKVILGCEHLNYKDRLEKLGLTTLLERRMRGDLIETFKILNGFTDYGYEWFHISEWTGKLVLKDTNEHNRNFFANRVVKYYNNLPNTIKLSTSVNMFKNKLDDFRKLYFNNITNKHYWELSYLIFNRIF